jgi:hypothetical protein
MINNISKRTKNIKIMPKIRENHMIMAKKTRIIRPNYAPYSKKYQIIYKEYLQKG